MSRVDEPFAGLFTQGMVTHESYRARGRRLAVPGGGRAPADGSAVHRGTGEPVDGRARRGDVEVASATRSIRARSSRATAPTPRAGSSCRTIRPSATWNGPRPAWPAPTGSPSGCSGWSKAIAALRGGRCRARRVRRRRRWTLRQRDAPDDRRRDRGAGGLRLQRRGGAASTSSPTRSPTPSGPRRAGRCGGLGWARREALDVLARLVAPMMPHLAEEMRAPARPGSTAAGGRDALAGGRSGARGGADA